MKYGGLGSMISEILCESDFEGKMFLKGLEEFVGSGKPLELEARYQLDPPSIAKFVLEKLQYI